MLQYTARRLIIAIPTLFAMSLVSFVLIQLPPGDFLTSYAAQLAQMGDYLAQRLAKVPELSGLPVNTYHVIAARLRPHEVKARDAIYRAGDPALGLFLVESGAIELRAETETNGDKVQTLGPGDLFGGLALLTGKPYAQNAVAGQESMVWRLSAEDFAAISHQHPGLRRTMARATRRLSRSSP